MICCAVVQALPRVCGVLLMSLLNQYRYGLLFLFFALWGLWPVFLVQNSSKGGAPSLERRLS